MLRKLQYICLVGSIGLVGDRIDLFAGHGPFTLNLFIILAPLFVLIRFLRERPTEMFRFEVSSSARRQTPYLIGGGLFLFLAMVSVPFSWDPERSVVAYADLLLVAILGFCIAAQILRETEPKKLILQAITFALLVYIVFCVGEIIALSHGMFMTDMKASSWIELTFAPQLSEFWVPRLSGATIDPNRAGFVLMMYLIMLDIFEVKSRYASVLRWTIAFLIFITMSRSTILCWCAYYVFSRPFWRHLVTRRTLAWVAASAVIISLLGVAYQRELGTLVEAWEISDAISARLSVGDASSGQNHIFLIERGFDAWRTSTKTVVTGIGLASAPKVLDDFFGDNKHGNFHCLFITVLAELGLPAFLVMVFLLSYPILGRKGAVSGSLAIIVFNLSYQAHMEPLFWIVLPLMWALEQRDPLKLRALVLSGVGAA